MLDGKMKPDSQSLVEKFGVSAAVGIATLAVSLALYVAAAILL
jgi:hypothetical protein